MGGQTPLKLDFEALLQQALGRETFPSLTISYHLLPKAGDRKASDSLKLCSVEVCAEGFASDSTLSAASGSFEVRWRASTDSTPVLMKLEA